MIVNSNSNGKHISYGGLGRFLPSRYILLICIANREKMGKDNTSIDLSEACNVSKRCLWTHLNRLESNKLVKKGKRILKNGNRYYNYILTEEAKQNLAKLAKNVHRFYNNS